MSERPLTQNMQQVLAVFLCASEHELDLTRVTNRSGLRWRAVLNALRDPADVFGKQSLQGDLMMGILFVALAVTLLRQHETKSAAGT
jgi:hypothetical protein